MTTRLMDDDDGAPIASKFKSVHWDVLAIVVAIEAAIDDRPCRHWAGCLSAGKRLRPRALTGTSCLAGCLVRRPGLPGIR